MSQELTTIEHTNGNHEVKDVDYEALAAQQRAKRQERCVVAINEALAAHNCGLQTVLQIGEQSVVVQNIGGLPLTPLVVAK